MKYASSARWNLWFLVFRGSYAVPLLSFPVLSVCLFSHSFICLLTHNYSNAERLGKIAVYSVKVTQSGKSNETTFWTGADRNATVHTSGRNPEVFFPYILVVMEKLAWNTLSDFKWHNGFLLCSMCGLYKLHRKGQQENVDEVTSLAEGSFIYSRLFVRSQCFLLNCN